jgi:hypothetical protein
MHRISALLLLAGALIWAQSPVPAPRVTGPIPATADSRMFNPAKTSLKPLDLSKAGYIEEEYMVSGTANVYDWAADGSVSVRTPNAPYTTKILIRRPAANFSGTAILEIPNIARRFDWAMMWSYSHDYFLEHGDAWIMVTMPASVEGLKKFNPARYKDLSFANPSQTPCANAKGGPNPNENGLIYDMFSQVAAALKGGLPGGFRVQRLYMTTQGGEITTYINAIHGRARLEGSRPAFDGYLVRNPPAPAAIHNCSGGIPAGDARRQIKDIDVPVVSVVAQGEVMSAFPVRKADSDAPLGSYRLYEVAAAAHIDAHAYEGFPSFAEQTEATGVAQGTPQWPFNARCEPEIVLQDLPLLRYAFNGAFANLDRWVKDGVAPPKVARLQVKDGALVLNEFGIGSGGIRSPYSDVPTASYTTSTGGPGNCRELGQTRPLSWARLEQLYGNHDNYVQRAAAAIDRMLRERWVTESDARRMREELLTTR